MNKELREKMNESAEDLYPSCVYRDEERAAFIAGSEAMYAELSPIVEWVSVKDSMPENMNKILVKGFIYGYGIKESSVEFANYYDGDFHSLIDKVTHWRKIEL